MVNLSFDAALGMVWRSAEESKQMVAEGKGISPSLHEFCLAGHLGLFKDGVYVTESEVHRPLAECWKVQHPLCQWGGRFGDGNHYSIAHRGLA